MGLNIAGIFLQTITILIIKRAIVRFLKIYSRCRCCQLTQNPPNVWAGLKWLAFAIVALSGAYFFIQRDGAMKQKAVSAAEKKTFTVGMVMPNRVQSILSQRTIGWAISWALSSAREPAPL